MNDSDDLQRLGQIVKRRREELGLTQQQAATTAGISVSTWREVESGTSRRRGLTMAAVARSLGWRTDAADVILEGGKPPLADEVDPPEKMDLRPRSREQQLAEGDALVAEIEAEEGRKALEAALSGGDPQLAALAGEWWDAPEDDREMVLQLMRRLRQRKLEVDMAETRRVFERAQGMTMEEFAERQRRRLLDDDGED